MHTYTHYCTYHFSPDEVAVCNLASINLSAMVTPAPVNNTPGTIAAAATFDFQRLYHISKVVTRNLNKVVDVNFYPVIEAKNSNMRHRPIGLMNNYDQAEE